VIRVGTDSPTPLHVPLPAGLAAIVMRCLEKDPKNRIQNVSELARMLAPYASDPLSAQQSAERASRILSGGRASHASMPMMGSGNGLSLTPPALTPRSWNQTNGSSLSGGAGQMGTKVVRGGRGMLIAGIAALCIVAGIGGFIVSNRMKGEGEAKPSAAPSAEMATDTPKPVPTTPSVDTATPATPTTPTTPPTTPTATDATKTAVTTDATKTAATTDATKTAATTDATKTAVTTDATKTDATKTAATAKTDATKTAATAKTDATKTVAKTVAKTDTTKSTKSTKTAAAKTTKSTAKTTKSTAKTTKTTKTTAPSGGGLFDDRK
jgi:hypothetical protein